MQLFYDQIQNIPRVEADDVAYLRSKVLTNRFVISSAGSNTIDISSLYEATCTLLDVVNVLLKIIWIEDIEVYIGDDHHEASRSYVRFTGYLILNDGKPSELFPIEGIVQFVETRDFPGDINFYEYQININTNHIAVYEYRKQRDISKVLSYQYNFPSPSVLRHEIQMTLHI